MGWLFSKRWRTRKDLIEHLVNGNGVKTLKHCTVGNHLWCVHEGHYSHGNRVGERVVFICLYIMAYHGKSYDGWGYKDIDESAGPIALSCPPSYLDMCTYPVNHYAYDWRQAVYARERRAKALKAGVRVKIGEAIYEIVKRVSPSSFEIVGEIGGAYRASVSTLLRGEVVA